MSDKRIGDLQALVSEHGSDNISECGRRCKHRGEGVHTQIWDTDAGTYRLVCDECPTESACIEEPMVDSAAPALSVGDETDGGERNG